MDYKVDEQFEHAGYLCCIVWSEGPPVPEGFLLDLAHYCGYVGIPKQHPLYGKGYNDSVPGVAKEQLNDSPIGERGIIPLLCYAGRKNNTVPIDVFFDVHGSITYARGEPDYPIENSKLWWFGFDCGHGGDTPEKCNRTFVREQCRSLAEQLAKLVPERIEPSEMDSSVLNVVPLIPDLV